MFRASSSLPLGTAQAAGPRQKHDLGVVSGGCCYESSWAKGASPSARALGELDTVKS